MQYTELVSNHWQLDHLFNSLFRLYNIDNINAHHSQSLCNTGRELRSGVKCIVVTIVTGSLWLARRYRWGQVNLKTISTIPSH